MKKILICIMALSLLLSPALLQAANPNAGLKDNQEKDVRAQGNPHPENASQPPEKATPERGKGLANAITHVPSFVAEKLSYTRKLFSDGARGIGQSLSDWIRSSFKPVVKNVNESIDRNKSIGKTGKAD